MQAFGHLKGALEMWWYRSPPAHCHEPRIIEPDIEEIEVVVAGYGDFKLGGSSTRVGPGGMAWYRPGETVEVTSDGDAPYETIVFRFQVNAKAVRGRSLAGEYHSWQSRPDCESYCRHVLSLYRRCAPFSDEEICCHYARLRWEALESRRVGLVLQQPLAIQRALQMIENHYLEPLSLADIAREADVSASHLFTLFRKCLGESPIQRIIHLRISRARELLATTTLSVKEVCGASGFNDMKYFCSRFKREAGQTPSEYRQHHAIPLVQ